MNREFKEHVKELVKEGLSLKDAHYIAVQLQKNEIIKDIDMTLKNCFGVNGQGPAYLEAIAMTLGFGNTGCKIAESINNVAESISGGYDE